MSSQRESIRRYWKPDGKKIDPAADAKLKGWMDTHAISTGAGAMTVFLNSPAHETARKLAIKALRIPKIK